MSDKVALVTGASVGIGRATAVALDQLGYRLILLARRPEKLKRLASELSKPCHTISCDINDHHALDQALSELPVDYEQIEVLINNAGLALGLEPANNTEWQHWQTMIQTNCLSLAYLTRQLIAGMVERNRGHIINMGSIAGTYAYRGGNVYGATKAFVEQFSLGLRTDLLGTRIRVTNLEPGLISGTEFSTVRFEGNQQAVEATYADCQPLSAEDIAETVRWVVSLPAHVNVNRMEIMPVCQVPGGVVVQRDET